MEVFKDTHLVKLELLSNATTIDNALNYIRSKQQSQQLKDSVTATGSETQTQPQTQSVF
jgi:hypothetical protein